MTDFRDFYSPADFDAYALRYANYVAHQNENSPEQEVRVDIWLKGRRQFELAIARFLQAKAAAGELKQVPCIAERGLRWGNAWNQLVTQGEFNIYAAETLTLGMGSGVLSLVMNHSGPCEPAALYEKLLAEVNDGCHFEPQSAWQSCSRTGKTLHLRMGSGWRPQYGTYQGTYNLTALCEDVPALAVHHNAITAPSGELLVSDWFRIPEFSSAVEYENRPSMESHAGLAAISAYYAKKHNFLSVFVGNTSPLVVERDGQFIVASAAYDENLNDNVQLEGNELGSVTTDLWWTSVIDRAVLTDIVSRALGQPRAEAAVQTMIEEYDMVTVRVPPGSTLHGYHLADKKLQEHFQCSEVNASGTDPLYLVASLTPLEWAPIDVLREQPSPASAPAP